MKHELVKEQILIYADKKSAGTVQVLTVPVTFPDEAVEQTEIKGRVQSSENLKALSGLAVGTVTNPEGEFKISVPDGIAILVFSYVGYEAKEVAVGTQFQIERYLQPSEA